jgi:hypothetical protein
LFGTIHRKNIIQKENKKNAAHKRSKTLEVKTPIDDAYQDWCDKSDEEKDFVCTAISNPGPIKGML